VSSTAVQPFQEIAQAVYDRLTGDATLMALVTGVFEHVPEGTAHDYVAMGEMLATPANRHNGFGRSVVFTLHVWTQARGFTSARAIEARLLELLDHQALAVPGHHVVSVRYEFSQTLTDPAPPGDIRHIPVRFRITTEQE
jgi:hypothetical protein